MLSVKDNEAWYGAGDIVQKILTDKTGNVWFGTSGGEGLVSFNTSSGKFTDYSLDDGPCNTEIGSLFEDRGGIIWIGTNEGVCRFDPTALKAGKQAFTKMDLPQYKANDVPEVKKNPNEVRMNSLVTSILQDKNGNLWFGTLNNGVFRYETQTGKFINYLSTEVIKCMFEDDAGTIWVGSWSNGGVYFLPPSQKEFIWKDGLSDGMIHCIFQDRKGDIWFGTRDKGVCRYNLETSKFNYFTEADGLCNNNVSCIVEDDAGNLWFGSSVKYGSKPGGICRYEPVSGLFIKYVPKVGIENSDIFCSAKDHSGNVWFGGRYGRLFKLEQGFGLFTDYSKELHKP